MTAHQERNSKQAKKESRPPMLPESEIVLADRIAQTLLLN